MKAVRSSLQDGKDLLEETLLHTAGLLTEERNSLAAVALDQISDMLNLKIVTSTGLRLANRYVSCVAVDDKSMFVNLSWNALRWTCQTFQLFAKEVLLDCKCRILGFHTSFNNDILEMVEKTTKLCEFSIESVLINQCLTQLGTWQKNGMCESDSCPNVDIMNQASKLKSALLKEHDAILYANKKTLDLVQEHILKHMRQILISGCDNTYLKVHLNFTNLMASAENLVMAIFQCCAMITAGNKGRSATWIDRQLGNLKSMAKIYCDLLEKRYKSLGVVSLISPFQLRKHILGAAYLAKKEDENDNFYRALDHEDVTLGEDDKGIQANQDMHSSYPRPSVDTSEETTDKITDASVPGTSQFSHTGRSEDNYQVLVGEGLLAIHEVKTLPRNTHSKDSKSSLAVSEVSLLQKEARYRVSEQLFPIASQEHDTGVESGMRSYDVTDTEGGVSAVLTTTDGGAVGSKKSVGKNGNCNSPSMSLDGRLVFPQSEASIDNVTEVPYSTHTLDGVRQLPSPTDSSHKMFGTKGGATESRDCVIEDEVGGESVYLFNKVKGTAGGGVGITQNDLPQLTVGGAGVIDETHINLGTGTSEPHKDNGSLRHWLSSDPLQEGLLVKSAEGLGQKSVQESGVSREDCTHQIAKIPTRVFNIKRAWSQEWVKTINSLSDLSTLSSKNKVWTNDRLRADVCLDNICEYKEAFDNKVQQVQDKGHYTKSPLNGHKPVYPEENNGTIMDSTGKPVQEQGAKNTSEAEETVVAKSLLALSNADGDGGRADKVGDHMGDTDRSGKMIKEGGVTYVAYDSDEDLFCETDPKDSGLLAGISTSMGKTTSSHRPRPKKRKLSSKMTRLAKSFILTEAVDVSELRRSKKKSRKACVKTLKRKAAVLSSDTEDSSDLESEETVPRKNLSRVRRISESSSEKDDDPAVILQKNPGDLMLISDSDTEEKNCIYKEQIDTPPQSDSELHHNVTTPDHPRIGTDTPPITDSEEEYDEARFSPTSPIHTPMPDSDSTCIEAWRGDNEVSQRKIGGYLDSQTVQINAVESSSGGDVLLSSVRIPKDDDVECVDNESGMSLAQGTLRNYEECGIGDCDNSSIDYGNEATPEYCSASRETDYFPHDNVYEQDDTMPHVENLNSLDMYEINGQVW